MLPLVKLYLERAENEMILAETVFKISSNSDLKENLNLGNETFYSAVISHCYYSFSDVVKSSLTTKSVPFRW